MHAISAPYHRKMTEPTQSGPYAGHPAPPHPGYRPTAPPGDPAAVLDRVSGSLLVLGALLAIGGSFATLDTSVQYLSEDRDEPIYHNVAKAWSYSSWATGEETTTVTQFSGIPLLIGGLLAVAAAVLLLTGRSRRLPLGPALAVGSAVLLLGTTLVVVTDAFNDTQWDTGDRTTTYGAGFYLLTVACLPALGATVTTVLATRRPAATSPGPARSWQSPQPPQPWQTPQPQTPQPQPAQPWQAAPAPQPYPPDRPPAPPAPPQG